MALRWFLILLLIALAPPAPAAEATFPTGSKIGLAPPPGMMVSRSFFGFEDPDNRVAFIIITLPPGAYPDAEQSTQAEPLQRQGVTVETREDLTLPVGKAVLVVGRQELQQIKLRKWILLAAAPDLTAVVTAQIPDEARAIYTDEVVRAALTSIVVRESVPMEEQLSLVPFKVNEMAGFRVGGILPGRALMLTDTPVDAASPRVDPQFVVAIAPGGPAQAADRPNFARDVFNSIPNVRDMRITSAEPLRMGGQQGFQIMGEGKDNATGTDVTVVQWLRFGGGAYMQLFGVAPTSAWTPAYTRFRRVRDGVEPR
jgi:hypothetical protein